MNNPTPKIVFRKLWRQPAMNFILLAATLFSICHGWTLAAEEVPWPFNLQPSASSDGDLQAFRNDRDVPAWPFTTADDLDYRPESVFDYMPADDAPVKESSQAKQKILQSVTLCGTWIPSGGSSGMSLARFHGGATFALPGPTFPQMTRSFFLLTPRVEYTHINWKQPTQFPESLYNAGLSVTWIQGLNQWWSMMFSVSPGWASDGKETHRSVRCPVMLGLTWVPNSQWKVSFGVAYLDRSDINVMPFGGVAWTLNDDWKVELTAPLARVARRLTSLCDQHISRWVYVGGGFDGGAWAIQSNNGCADFAMYREYSVLLGYEANRKDSCSWNCELGFLFGRKMEFENQTQPDVRPDDALVLRMKVAF